MVNICLCVVIQNVDLNLSSSCFHQIFAPLVHYCFAKVKEKLSVRHFNSVDVTSAVDHFLAVQHGNFYKKGILILHDGSAKCINVGGDGVEKLTCQVS